MFKLRCWFYKRFLSRQLNAQFHYHMEIASAKNTFPIYHSAIPPLYMWSIKDEISASVLLFL